MNSKTDVHWSFWVIVAVGLIWYVMGTINFFMQMNSEAVAEMPEHYRALIEARSAWAKGFFGLAVVAGALGCVLLFLRKSVATYLFIASLVGVVVQLIPVLRMAGSPTQVWLGVLASLGVAAFLIWYTKLAEGKGWIS